MKAWLVALLFSYRLVEAGGLLPVVEIEEDVYTFTSANNGAGPMWCHGSTCLVRSGKHLFASGIETVSDAKPLNNCRWMLFERKSNDWERVYLNVDGRTREPVPMATFADGRVFVSVNPTLSTDPEPNGGPARPDVIQFMAADAKSPPESLRPVWQDDPKFSEHSYRSFAADGRTGELMLFQNIGYTHAEWTFRDRHNHWSAQGQLKWPWGAEYDKPEPIRICYPNVAIQNRAVHFFGVSDVVEPYKAWREFKRELTGQQWDYDFRRLFYTWTPDITNKPFAEWVEIASRDKTCGWVSPGDLYVASNGDVQLLWTERALDDRLRPKFFPDSQQSHTLNYAVIREGKVIKRRVLVESTEDQPGIIASGPRFQVTPERRLFVIYYAAGQNEKGQAISENRISEIRSGGVVTAPVRIPFKQPFTTFYTTTVRGGSTPSRTLEMLGQHSGEGNRISYACVRLF
jgi:hypothetical protein